MHVQLIGVVQLLMQNYENRKLIFFHFLKISNKILFLNDKKNFKELITYAQFTIIVTVIIY